MEFIIPLKKDDLLKQNDRYYYVKDVISPRQINSVFDSKYLNYLLLNTK